MIKTQISKAVIACGGLGTRFLPVTKSVPKELLPIIDTPVLAYVVNEAANAGAKDILIILSRGKEAIASFFSRSSILEQRLLDMGRHDLFGQLVSVIPDANISFTYQDNPCGSGDALLCARSFTKDEPFFLSYADDLICSSVPALTQLLQAYAEGCHVVGVKQVEGEEISLYGAARVKRVEGEGVFLCSGFEEKMPLCLAPSNLAVTGRYLFSEPIYEQLLRTKKVEGELRLTDAINSLCKGDNVFAKALDGKRFDCGDRLGALTANIEFGLRRDFGGRLREYLRSLVATF